MDSGVLVGWVLICYAHCSGIVRHDFGKETLLNAGVLEIHSLADRDPNVELFAHAVLDEMDRDMSHQVANRIVPWPAALGRSLLLHRVLGHLEVDQSACSETQVAYHNSSVPMVLGHARVPSYPKGP